jgi:3-oxoacyl-[acyl-carrier-protein] synthase II
MPEYSDWRASSSPASASPRRTATAPEFRANLLAGRSGVQPYEIRHVGKTLAGVCDYDALRYQTKKDLRRGTRAGSIAVYCANEAVKDAGLELARYDRQRIGVFPGITEHGNVETENEIHEVAKYQFDLSYWSHHHNPRTVANNPAGEVTLNLGLKGPAYCLGGACAAGNLGLIHGAQLLRLGEIDLSLAGGVSESIRTFGIFASCGRGRACEARGSARLAPLSTGAQRHRRRGGRRLFALERLEERSAARGAHLRRAPGHCANPTAPDSQPPDPPGRTPASAALASARLSPRDRPANLTHATSTSPATWIEARVVRESSATAEDVGQQHQELHRPRHGRRRRARARRQPAVAPGRRRPSHDQPRRARSRVRDPEPRRQLTACRRTRRHDPEHVLRHARHQLGRRRRTPAGLNVPGPTSPATATRETP